MIFGGIFQIRAVRAFASLLRQYTSLNHLAQAARSVFQNSEQVKQMITDFNKINFDCILVSLLGFHITRILTYEGVNRKRS